jgi:hypothetical protein
MPRETETFLIRLQVSSEPESNVMLKKFVPNWLSSSAGTTVTADAHSADGAGGAPNKRSSVKYK